MPKLQTYQIEIETKLNGAKADLENLRKEAEAFESTDVGKNITNQLTKLEDKLEKETATFRSQLNKINSSLGTVLDVSKIQEQFEQLSKSINQTLAPIKATINQLNDSMNQLQATMHKKAPKVETPKPETPKTEKKEKAQPKTDWNQETHEVEALLESIVDLTTKLNTLGTSSGQAKQSIKQIFSAVEVQNLRKFSKSFDQLQKKFRGSETLLDNTINNFFQKRNITLGSDLETLLDAFKNEDSTANSTSLQINATLDKTTDINKIKTELLGIVREVQKEIDQSNMQIVIPVSWKSIRTAQQEAAMAALTHTPKTVSSSVVQMLKLDVKQASEDLIKSINEVVDEASKSGKLKDAEISIKPVFDKKTVNKAFEDAAENAQRKARINTDPDADADQQKDGIVQHLETNATIEIGSLEGVAQDSTLREILKAISTLPGSKYEYVPTEAELAAENTKPGTKDEKKFFGLGGKHFSGAMTPEGKAQQKQREHLYTNRDYTATIAAEFKDIQRAIASVKDDEEALAILRNTDYYKGIVEKWENGEPEPVEYAKFGHHGETPELWQEELEKQFWTLRSASRSVSGIVSEKDAAIRKDARLTKQYEYGDVHEQRFKDEQEAMKYVLQYATEHNIDVPRTEMADWIHHRVKRIDENTKEDYFTAEIPQYVEEWKENALEQLRISLDTALAEAHVAKDVPTAQALIDKVNAQFKEKDKLKEEREALIAANNALPQNLRKQTKDLELPKVPSDTDVYKAAGTTKTKYKQYVNYVAARQYQEQVKENAEKEYAALPTLSTQDIYQRMVHDKGLEASADNSVKKPIENFAQISKELTSELETFQTLQERFEKWTTIETKLQADLKNDATLTDEALTQKYGTNTLKKNFEKSQAINRYLSAQGVQRSEYDVEKNFWSKKSNLSKVQETSKDGNTRALTEADIYKKYGLTVQDVAAMKRYLDAESYRKELISSTPQTRKLTLDEAYEELTRNKFAALQNQILAGELGPEDDEVKALLDKRVDNIVKAARKEIIKPITEKQKRAEKQVKVYDRDIYRDGSQVLNKTIEEQVLGIAASKYGDRSTDEILGVFRTQQDGYGLDPKTIDKNILRQMNKAKTVDQQQNALWLADQQYSVAWQVISDEYNKNITAAQLAADNLKKYIANQQEATAADEERKEAIQQENIALIDQIQAMDIMLVDYDKVLDLQETMDRKTVGTPEYTKASAQYEELVAKGTRYGSIAHPLSVSEAQNLVAMLEGDSENPNDKGIIGQLKNNLSTSNGYWKKQKEKTLGQVFNKKNLSPQAYEKNLVRFFQMSERLAYLTRVIGTQDQVGVGTTLNNDSKLSRNWGLTPAESREYWSIVGKGQRPGQLKQLMNALAAYETLNQGAEKARMNATSRIRKYHALTSVQGDNVVGALRLSSEEERDHIMMLRAETQTKLKSEMEQMTDEQLKQLVANETELIDAFQPTVNANKSALKYNELQMQLAGITKRLKNTTSSAPFSAVAGDEKVLKWVQNLILTRSRLNNGGDWTHLASELGFEVNKDNPQETLQNILNATRIGSQDINGKTRKSASQFLTQLLTATQKTVEMFDANGAGAGHEAITEKAIAKYNEDIQYEENRLRDARLDLQKSKDEEAHENVIASKEQKVAEIQDNLNQLLATQNDIPTRLAEKQSELDDVNAEMSSMVDIIRKDFGLNSQQAVDSFWSIWQTLIKGVKDAKAKFKSRTDGVSIADLEQSEDTAKAILNDFLNQSIIRGSDEYIRAVYAQGIGNHVPLEKHLQFNSMMRDFNRIRHNAESDERKDLKRQYLNQYGAFIGSVQDKDGNTIPLLQERQMPVNGKNGIEEWEKFLVTAKEAEEIDALTQQWNSATDFGDSKLGAIINYFRTEEQINRILAKAADPKRRAKTALYRDMTEEEAAEAEAKGIHRRKVPIVLQTFTDPEKNQYDVTEDEYNTLTQLYIERSRYTSILDHNIGQYEKVVQLSEQQEALEADIAQIRVSDKTVRDRRIAVYEQQEYNKYQQVQDTQTSLINNRAQAQAILDARKAERDAIAAENARDLAKERKDEESRYQKALKANGVTDEKIAQLQSSTKVGNWKNTGWAYYSAIDEMVSRQVSALQNQAKNFDKSKLNTFSVSDYEELRNTLGGVDEFARIYANIISVFTGKSTTNEIEALRTFLTVSEKKKNTKHNQKSLQTISDLLKQVNPAVTMADVRNVIQQVIAINEDPYMQQDVRNMFAKDMSRAHFYEQQFRQSAIAQKQAELKDVQTRMTDPSVPYAQRLKQIPKLKEQRSALETEIAAMQQEYQEFEKAFANRQAIFEKEEPVPNMEQVLKLYQTSLDTLYNQRFVSGGYGFQSFNFDNMVDTVTEDLMNAQQAYDFITRAVENNQYAYDLLKRNGFNIDELEKNLFEQARKRYADGLLAEYANISKELQGTSARTSKGKELKARKIEIENILNQTGYGQAILKREQNQTVAFQAEEDLRKAQATRARLEQEHNDILAEINTVEEKRRAKTEAAVEASAPKLLRGSLPEGQKPTAFTPFDELAMSVLSKNPKFIDEIRQHLPFGPDTSKRPGLPYNYLLNGKLITNNIATYFINKSIADWEKGIEDALHQSVQGYEPLYHYKKANRITHPDVFIRRSNIGQIHMPTLDFLPPDTEFENVSGDRQYAVFKALQMKSLLGPLKEEETIAANFYTQLQSLKNQRKPFQQTIDNWTKSDVAKRFPNAIPDKVKEAQVQVEEFDKQIQEMEDQIPALFYMLGENTVKVTETATEAATKTSEQVASAEEEEFSWKYSKGTDARDIAWKQENSAETELQKTRRISREKYKAKMNAWRAAGMTEEQAQYMTEIQELNGKRLHLARRGKELDPEDQVLLEHLWESAKESGLEIDEDPDSKSHGYVKALISKEDYFANPEMYATNSVVRAGITAGQGFRTIAADYRVDNVGNTVGLATENTLRAILDKIGGKTSGDIDLDAAQISSIVASILGTDKKTKKEPTLLEQLAQYNKVGSSASVKGKQSNKIAELVTAHPELIGEKSDYRLAWNGNHQFRVLRKDSDAFKDHENDQADILDYIKFKNNPMVGNLRKPTEQFDKLYAHELSKLLDVTGIDKDAVFKLAAANGWIINNTKTKEGKDRFFFSSPSNEKVTKEAVDFTNKYREATDQLAWSDVQAAQAEAKKAQAEHKAAAEAKKNDPAYDFRKKLSEATLKKNLVPFIQANLSDAEKYLSLELKKDKKGNVTRLGYHFKDAKGYQENQAEMDAKHTEAMAWLGKQPTAQANAQAQQQSADAQQQAANTAQANAQAQQQSGLQVLSAIHGISLSEGVSTEKADTMETLVDTIFELVVLANPNARNAVKSAALKGLNTTGPFQGQNFVLSKDTAKTAQDIMQNYINGIKATYPELDGVMTEAMQVVIDACTRVMDINSPSETMRKLGWYSAEGFRYGILDDTDGIRKAVEEAIKSGLITPEEAEELGKWARTASASNELDATSKTRLKNLAVGSGNIPWANRMPQKAYAPLMASDQVLQAFIAGLIALQTAGNTLEQEAPKPTKQEQEQDLKTAEDAKEEQTDAEEEQQAATAQEQSTEAQIEAAEQQTEAAQEQEQVVEEQSEASSVEQQVAEQAEQVVQEQEQAAVTQEEAAAVQEEAAQAQEQSTEAQIEAAEQQTEAAQEQANAHPKLTQNQRTGLNAKLKKATPGSQEYQDLQRLGLEAGEIWRNDHFIKNTSSGAYGVTDDDIKATRDLAQQLGVVDQFEQSISKDTQKDNDAKREATEYNRALAKEYERLLRNSIRYYDLSAKQSSQGYLSDFEKDQLEKLKTDRAIISQLRPNQEGSKTSFEMAKAAWDRFGSMDSTLWLNKEQSELEKLMQKSSDMQKQPKYTDAYKDRLAQFNARVDKLLYGDLDNPNATKLFTTGSVADPTLFAQLTQEIAKIKAEWSDVFNSKTNQKNLNANIITIDKLRAKVAQLLNENGRMSSDLRSRFQALGMNLDSVKSMGGGSRAVTGDLAAQYQGLVAELQASGKTGDSFFGMISKRLKGFNAQIIGMYFSWFRVIGYIQQGLSVFQQFDDALTKISYTMDLTDTALADMGNDIVDLAKDMDTSLSTMSQIYQIYSNMQTTSEEIAEEAAPTAILANLTGMDASTAADDIQGVINQFDLLAEDSMHIADVYDYISRNIAVDYSKGISSMAEAVQAVGNVAYQSGLSFEQLSSIIAKTSEQTRMEGSQIANGLKTIMVRLSKASSMDDEVDNSTLSNASAALHSIGVEVYNASGEFREFDTIMTELANKWDTLTDSQQANISFQIAATRQTAVLKAILQNWIDSMDLATEATETNGNALENNEKYIESYSGKLQQIKTNVEDLWLNIINSDAADRILDILESITEHLDELTEATGMWGAILVGGAGVGIYQLIKNFKTLITIGEQFNLARAINAYKTNIDMEALVATLGQYSLAAQESAFAQSTLNYSQLEAIYRAQGYDAALAETMATEMAQTTALNRMGTANVSTTISTDALKVSIQKLGSALAGIFDRIEAFMGGIGGLVTIVAAIAAGEYALVKWADGSSDFSDGFEDLSDADDNLQSIQSDLEDLNTEFDSIVDQIKELESLDSLTFVQQGDLETLIQTRKELEKTIALKAQEATKEAQSNSDDAVSQYTSQYGGRAYSYLDADYKTAQQRYNELRDKAFEATNADWDQSGHTNVMTSSEQAEYHRLIAFFNHIPNWISNFDTDATFDNLTEEFKNAFQISSADDWGDVLSYYQDYIKYGFDGTQGQSIGILDHIQDLVDRYNSLYQQSLDEALDDETKTTFDNIETELTTIMSDFGTYQGYYIGEDDDLKQTWQAGIDLIEQTLYSSDVLTNLFNDWWDDVAQNTKSALIEAAQDGTLTTSMFNSLGIKDSALSSGLPLSSLVEQINASYGTTGYGDTYLRSLQSLFSADSENKIDTFQDKMSKIKDAFEELSTGKTDKDGVIDLLQEFGEDITPEQVNAMTSSYSGLVEVLQSVADDALADLLEEIGDVNEYADPDAVQAWVNVFTDLYQEATKATDSMQAVQEAISGLDTLTDGLSELNSTYSTLKGKSKLEFSDLVSLKEQFGDLDSFGSFATIVSQNSSLTSEVQNAYDTLLNEWLSKDELRQVWDDIDDDNIDFYTMWFEKLGINSKRGDLKTAIQNSKLAINAREAVDAIDGVLESVLGSYDDDLTSEMFDTIQSLIDSDSWDVGTLKTGQYNDILQAVGLSASSDTATLQEFVDTMNSAGDSSADYAVQLVKTAEVSDEARKYLAAFTFQKNKENLTALDEESDVKNLIYLAETADISSQALKGLYTMQEVYNNLASIDTSESVKSLVELGKQLAIDTAMLSELGRLQSMTDFITKYENGYWNDANGEYGGAAVRKAMYESYKKQIANYDTSDLAQSFADAFNYEFDWSVFDLSNFDSSSLDLDLDADYTGNEDTGEPETIDWVEIKLQRIEEEIDRLDTKASSTWDNWSNRTKSLNKELDTQRSLLTANQKAYSVYMKKANSIALSADLKKKVREGNYSIEDYDSDTADLINDYQEWYEKAIEAQDTVNTIKNDIADTIQTAFDNITTQAEEKIDRIQHKIDKLETTVSQITDSGHVVSSSVYQKELAQNAKEQSQYEAELDALIKKRDEAVASGDIKKGSEQWYEMTSSIEEVENSIQDCVSKTIELNNAIRDLKYDKWEFINQEIENTIAEGQFLIDLMEEGDNLFEENGSWTDEAQASSALHVGNYNMYTKQAKEYANEISKLDKMYADDTDNKDYIEKREELVSNQQEAIKNAKAEKEAIVDLYEQGYSKLTEYVSDLADEYMEALNAAKDLYDYEKSIEDKTKNIASLEKQLRAYEGDDSEETQATIQKLKVELEDAQEDLQETEWSQLISDQQDMLDTFQEDLQDWVDDRLDDIEGLFKEQVAASKDLSETIASTIGSATSGVGYNLSTETINSITNASGVLSDIKSTTSDVYNGHTSASGSSLNGYATGGKNITDVLAWTQEQGAEIIRRSDGALLTPVKGSTVFNADQTNALWALSKGLLTDGLTGTGMEAVAVSNISGGDVNNNVQVAISLPNVSDYNDFVTQLKNDNKFEKYIQQITVGEMMGKASLSKKKY